MNTLVMKFGGASLSTPLKIKRSVEIVCEKKRDYKNIVVVVSAMGKMTDNLLTLSKKICTSPPVREQDMLVSAGERISMALFAMALYEKKFEAISFTGSQAGIITTNEHFNAKIIDVKPSRILEKLKENKIVIVAGFQGVSVEKEITTLGRGGSDTSAVALGVALFADRVEFYKDVDGIYLKDPKIDPNAFKIDQMTYDEAISLLSKGAKILHIRSVYLAQKNNIPLHVLSFKKSIGGTLIKDKYIRDKKILYEK